MLKRATYLLAFLLSGLAAHAQPKTLDYYLQQAIKNSPLLNQYRNEALSAGYDSMLVRASQKPRVEFNTSLQYFPYNDKFGYDEVITDGGNYSTLAGVSQTLFNRRDVDNRIAAASLLREAALNSSKVSEIELIKVITAQYLTALSDQADLQFNRNFLNLFRDELKVTAAFVESGSAKETDYLSLLTESRAQEILIKQIESQFRKDVYLLNQLCGSFDTIVFDLQSPGLKLTGRADVRNDPSFQKFSIDSIRLENEKDAIDVRYRPKIKWFADAGLLTSTPWNFYRHFGISAGVSLNVPIWDGNQRSIEKDKLQAEENSRQFYSENYRNQYFHQVNRLTDELSRIDDIEKSLNEQVKTSDLLTRAFKTQLESGIVQMTDYINALRSYKNASRDLNLIGITRMQVINELNYFLIH
ncbi:MAG TPA: TolC family protein [Bacteroidales bacterium]|nr:TolC family protein [Bacteroidales bacterium]